MPVRVAWLRRRGVNLLAGRAVEGRLHPFTPAELGARFDLEEALSLGTLPLVWSAADRTETHRIEVMAPERFARELDRGL